VSEDRIVDAAGGVVLPGFVDCHTHLVFAGDRSAEWEQRMSGKPYLEILREGGGIRSTVEKTRAASFDSLEAGARTWALRALAQGTTTLEAKSGYCLDPEGELKLLSVAKAVAAVVPSAVVSTFLAHVIPADRASDRARYLSELLALLPAIRERDLAEFVDVFCEKEAFTLTESEALLARAAELGFGLKLHAEQFTDSGAAKLGARLAAVSVDHLEHASPDTIAALAASKAIGVLLPGVPFHLGMNEHAPARALIEAGVPIALASDFNPGSSFTCSIPMVIALACRTLKLSASEAVVATTINAAHALNRAAKTGSIEPTKRADLLVCDVPDHRWLGYAFGWNPVRTVVAGGRRVVN
jgi:imidazolonepropionase